ncbi:N-acetylglucosamine kinase-like BadF-type ATPase [Microbacterium sp. SLBN-154]|uniref:N-acetylglucosamine kinase n=1 Tax=Microbacterium sp. SLBN-154 TaxID=2768458 RepID=UPI00114DF547|nr:BadF/BadG/BcrA/BcrD ATPase family protein [Microbacterium sp. SLBN-154]TQK18833.1 N-acetylglucosamine kinase-like BadF-type ATPase [Microbacterium sp. SLBN-154]
MTAGSAVVAIDAGQTGMKVRVAPHGAAPVDQVFPGIRTHEPLLPQLASVAIAAARHHEVRIDVLAAGVSGLTEAESDASSLRAAVAAEAPDRVLLAHDSVTSYLGALGDRPGAVVAAGTGVVTLAVGKHRVARVDGWGNIMGDAGSGYWIGREALESVMRAYDGRGPRTALSGLVAERWPVVESAYIELQGADDRVAQIAALARGVAELAADDEVAADICRRAAAELALSVATALDRVADDPDAQAQVAAIGGVFRAEVIRAGFAHELALRHPRAHLRPAQGAGVDGTAELARLGPGHPLLSHVSVA